MESIAMLNGIPTQLDRYLTSQARSVVLNSDYNMNLAGLGQIPGQPVMAASSGPGFASVNPPKQRGGWVRRNLQEGLSKRAAASLMGSPTTALSVSEQVRMSSIASQQFANRLAGIPESPAAYAAAARAGNIVSQQYNANLAGLGADAGVADDKLFGMPKALVYGIAGLALGFGAAKLMK